MTYLVTTPQSPEVTAQPEVKKKTHCIHNKKALFFDLIQTRKVPIYNVGHE